MIWPFIVAHVASTAILERRPILWRAIGLAPSEKLPVSAFTKFGSGFLVPLQVGHHYFWFLAVVVAVPNQARRSRNEQADKSEGKRSRRCVEAPSIQPSISLFSSFGPLFRGGARIIS
jgi:hypothetical protein